MAFLIRVFIFLIILWTARSLLSAFVRKSRQPQKPDQGDRSASLTVKDPVCGMYMDPRLAIRSGDRYFCSEDCLRKYKNSSV